MSFLSNPVTSRRLVLICARLSVQCVMGWSIPQLGVDEAKFLGVPPIARSEFAARQDGEPIASAACLPPGQRLCTRI